MVSSADAKWESGALASISATLRARKSPDSARALAMRCRYPCSCLCLCLCPCLSLGRQEPGKSLIPKELLLASRLCPHPCSCLCLCLCPCLSLVRHAPQPLHLPKRPLPLPLLFCSPSYPCGLLQNLGPGLSPSSSSSDARTEPLSKARGGRREGRARKGESLLPDAFGVQAFGLLG